MTKFNEQLILDYAIETITQGTFSLFIVYQKFLEQYATDIDSFINSPQAYKYFLYKYQSLLIDPAYNKPITNEKIDSFISSITKNYTEQFDTKHKNHANLVQDLFPTKSDHILDVGAGSVPSISMMLAQDGRKTTALEEELIISRKTLENLHVTPLETYFDNSTDITPYDAITGRRPCEAIINMVRKSKKHSKPYLIALCNCKFPTLYDICMRNIPDASSIDIPKLMKKVQFIGEEGSKQAVLKATWSDLLPQYDRDIKIIGDYATNLDIRSNTFKKYLEKHHLLDEKNSDGM